MCVRVCRPPIIMVVWEDCFGMLAVVSVCKWSHLISRVWIITGAHEEAVYIPKQNPGFTAASPNFPPTYPWPSVGFEASFMVYLFTLQSHLWITVLAISGFGGLMQIPLFVNSATFPKLI